MADVIKLSNKHVDTSSVYDTSQSKTQSAINSSVSSSLTSISNSISSINTNLSNLSGKVSTNTSSISSLNKKVLFTIRQVSTSRADGSYSTWISAPTISDYTFKFWIGVASYGSVGAPYMEYYQNSSTNIWDSVSGARSYYAFAFYQHN